MISSFLAIPYNLEIPASRDDNSVETRWRRLAGITDTPIASFKDANKDARKFKRVRCVG